MAAAKAPRGGRGGLLLTVDVGNTNVVAGLSRGNLPVGRAVRLATDTSRTGDEWAALLESRLRPEIPRGGRISAAILGSVVPPLDAPLAAAVRDLFAVDLADAAPIVRRILPILPPKPEEIGADRLLDALGARDRFGSPVIVVDVGTATTFDVVDRNGAFAGGVIAPGPLLGAEALAARTARLPKVEILRPAAVLGTDTVGAIRSGLFWGYVGLIEGILARLRKESGRAPVVATGGLSALFAGEGLFDAVDPELTLHGLRLAHAARRSSRAG